MAPTKTASMRMALLCVCLLATLCGSANALSFGGDDVRGVVKGVVDNIQGVVRNVTYKAEDVFKYDLNNDGQIGEFRSQEEAIDRKVGGDPNAGGRFQVNRPRTGRMLAAEEQETKSAPAPMLRK